MVPKQTSHPKANLSQPENCPGAVVLWEQQKKTVFTPQYIIMVCEEDRVQSMGQPVILGIGVQGQPWLQKNKDCFKTKQTVWGMSEASKETVSAVEV